MWKPTSVNLHIRCPMVIVVAPVSAPRMIRDDLIPRRILNPGIIVSPEEVQVRPIDLVGSG